MNVHLTILQVLAASGDDEVTVDNKGIVTHNPMLPETAEIIYGGLASLIIFFLLYKFGWPLVKKGLDARAERVQKELDGASADVAAAKAEAENIRKAKGDIDAERNRIMAEARTQAEAVLADGRVRIDEELAEVRTRAAADVEAARSRVTDELRFEISRLSAAAIDRAVEESLDAATQQQLIESFISEVGQKVSAA